MSYLDYEKLETIDPAEFQQATPYPWLNPAGTLTETGYQRLLASLPDISMFEPMFGVKRSHGQQPHDRYVLEYRDKLDLQPCWREFIAELKGEAAAGKKPGESASGRGYRDFNLRIFNDKPWDPVSNPVAISWLPDAVNHSLNKRIKRAIDVAKSDDGQASIGKALFNVLPQTLLVLMPIFALMLKIAYLFKRRLYMEHLIVALHSHAFLCLTLLLVCLVVALGHAAPAIGGLTTFLEVLLFAWMPVYLLLMQKRVYRQGWILTLLKYGVLGFSYIMLLSFGAVFTVLASLVWA